MNILYRLSHASEKKYLDLFKVLKAKVIDLGFKMAGEQDEQYTITEIYRIYHALNTKSDNLEIDFRNDLIKFFPDQKLNIKSENIYALFRILESIDEQSSTIRRIPIEIDGVLYTEFGASEDYGDSFAALREVNNPEFFAQDPSSDEEEAQPVIKKKKEETKVNYTNQKEDAERMSRIEDIKNHFKEFFYKFKHLIFDKEFWALFLNDIVSDLKSGLDNESLFAKFMSPEYFNDIEAAHYLVEHREKIVKYLEVVNIQQSKPNDKNKKDGPMYERPSNFGVKIDGKNFQSSEYAAYDESLAGQTNYEVLALLVINNLKTSNLLGNG